jgi:hypothetical protein
MRVKAIYDGYTVKLPNSAGEMQDLGNLMSGRALAGLVRVKAFIYEAEEGRISVRLECKARGSSAGYWFAYKRLGGKLLKLYLCEAYALDPWLLDSVARRLLPDPQDDHNSAH